MTLQDKLNALTEEQELYDPETASSSGMSRVPGQPWRVPSSRGMLIRDSGLPHFFTEFDGYLGNVFGNPSAPETISPSLPGIATRHGEGLRRARFSRRLDASNSSRRSGGTFDGNSEVCYLGTTFRKMPTLR